MAESPIRNRLSLPSENPYLASLRSRRLGFDDDLDIPSEGVQEPKEPLGREAFQTSPHQRGYLWLVYAKQGSGFALGESSPYDYVTDLRCNLRLGQGFFSIRQAEVGENVAG